MTNAANVVDADSSNGTTGNNVVSGNHLLRRPRFLTKEVCSNASSKPKRIRNIQFSMMSGSDIERSSVLHVSNKQFYDIGTREPVQYGCLDRRLGISDKDSKCQTCQKPLQSCTGHFGYIQLAAPVFHIGFYKAIQNVLQTICKNCGNVLLSSAEKKKFIIAMTHPKSDSIAKANTRKRIMNACKKVRQCEKCAGFNGTVRRVAGSDSFKLVHEMYKLKEFKNSKEALERPLGYLKLAETNSEFDATLLEKATVMNPEVVLKLFEKIDSADLPLLWSNEEHSHPAKMLLTHLFVPPVAIRPSVKMDAQGTNEDDLTSKLQEILEVNNEMRNQENQGCKSKKFQELWNVLQVRVGQFINGELPGLFGPVRREMKPMRGLVQRLKGKQGRFRGNLSGKRVDFSGRTVISPDPNLRITQVGVPLYMARKLTYPEIVNEHNYERLKQAIRNGPETHPGANFIRTNSDHQRPRDESNEKFNRHYRVHDGFQSQSLINLAFGDKRERAKSLKLGDTVDRHVVDGDIVLFNRQPSLHKMSIMSHRVKVLEGKTLRFNECVCAPYNADFDGDEMNIHVPQNEESRTEADVLMGVQNNLITPRNGEPLVTATQDFITSAFLMTRRDIFLSREEFCNMVAKINDAAEHIVIPPPAVLKPVQLWTGKQLWNVLLKPNNRRKWPLVNLETKERNHRPNDDGRWMCPEEGWVVFRNSELLCGSLGKSTLGGSKSGLFYVLIRDHSTASAAAVMNRMTKLCTRWLSVYGFTIGIDDVTPSEDLLRRKQQEIGAGYKLCETFIKQSNEGTLQTRPGCSADESLESEISGVLSKVRDKAGQMCMETLPRYNKPYIMATCGSKGSALNICQMMVCVGQQIVGGKRMPNGFVRRTLPHFDLNAKEPSAKGFVANSFYSGLTAPEFFFHTMGGREGLVDTAVKTAETGYMARRLMKALEDLSVSYDCSVRNSQNGVVQFSYGDDGLNPGFMEDKDRPVDFKRLERQIKATLPDVNNPALSPEGIRKLISSDFKDLASVLAATKLGDRFHRHLLENNKEGLSYFIGELKFALHGLASTLASTCTKLGIHNYDDYEERFPCSTRDEINEYFVGVIDRYGSLDGYRRAEKTAEEKEKSRWITLTKISKTTKKQVYELVLMSMKRFLLALTEPGEAVGAIGAQSLGEPGTQMTLKTFHFAGVASMNVTLGVPRIKEIINASKTISTPIITVVLDGEAKMEETARIVQGRLEATKLGEVAEWIEEVYSEKRCLLVVKLSRDTITKLHRESEITLESVREKIFAHKPLKLKANEHNIMTNRSRNLILIEIPSGHKLGTVKKKKKDEEDEEGLMAGNPTLYFTVQTMKDLLMDVIVSGIPSIKRAVVNRCEDEDDKFEILVEGLGFQQVLGTTGVDKELTRTNHIMEMEQVLGIEAARKLVMDEVAYIFGRYGLSIDKRHLMLLADVMSYRGVILGITRFGIAKMKESVLMLASFEKTADHLFDAAIHARNDSIDGVSECIIMGTPIPVGTGMFKVLAEWEKSSLISDRPAELDQSGMLGKDEIKRMLLPGIPVESLF